MGMTIEKTENYSSDELAAFETKVAQGDVQAAYDLGLLYYEGRFAPYRYKETVRLWEIAAAAGHVDAQIGLADCYLYGCEYDDEKKALALYNEFRAKYPDRMHPLCQLGRIYTYGWGVQADVQKGLQLLQEAWRGGHVRAAAEIGNIYLYKMNHTKEDTIEGVKWLQRAADMNDEKGCYELGYVYHTGDFGPQDESMAYALFMRAPHYPDTLGVLLTSDCCGIGSEQEKAEIVKEALRWAENGNTHLRCEIGRAYQKGTCLPHDNALAEQWYVRAIDNGSGYAAFLLGTNFIHQFDGFERDMEKAIKYLTFSAEHGIDSAKSTLGDLYDDLDDYDYYAIPYDERRQLAIKWWAAAAECGDSWCAMKVARYFDNGEKYDEAIKYYQIAANMKNDSAYLELAKIYIDPSRGHVDYEAAKKYFALAYQAADYDFKKGEVDFYLAQMYENGWGYPQNYEQAVKHYSQAAEYGYPFAKDALAHFKKGLFGWKKI